MTTPSLSNFVTETSLSRDFQPQQPGLINRRQPRLISIRLALITALVGFLLSTVNTIPALAFGSVIQNEEPAVASNILNPNAAVPSTQFARPEASRDPIWDIVVPPDEELPPLQSDILLPVAPSPSTAVDLPAATPTDTVTNTSQAEIEHVVIITIDGMGPEALDMADTPSLDSLIAKGAYSPNAQTINPSYTLPSHVSMLNGVVPQKHGIVEALPCIGCRLTIGPTLFSVAHDAGLSTGMVFGKEKLNYLVLPNSVDKLFGAEAHDMEVKEQAVAFIEEGLPNVLFIHFPDTDRVGHAYGWMTPNYLYAITYADGLVGEIVATLESEGYLDSTLLIVTADHGGHNKEHGLDCSEDRSIPWLAVGPGVPQGVLLTSQINTFDTAATAAYAFDLPIPEHWDGKPVLEIFE